jgi:alpha-L-rhamnosidase
MKNPAITHLILFLLISSFSSAQNNLPAENPEHLKAQDVLSGFINPPEGYGEVPFYWWQGDTLTRERLLWQLDKLAGKGISSLQVNYSHRDSGGLTYGLSNPSKPGLFTKAWWDLFRWFSAEAQKRGMTVSLSDYTLGIGQGFSMDEAIRNDPGLNGSVLRCSSFILKGSGSLLLPENILTLTACRIREDSSMIKETRKDMLPAVKGGRLFYNSGDSAWRLTCVYPVKLIPSYDPMNSESGNAYNRYFFDKFENELPGKGKGKLNFFFSDELNFRLSGNIWDSTFAEEFRKRKGYDIVPCLDALFTDTGPLTPKIKLDYNDVIVTLSEENFFKPVYQWHQARGMIFGCDHGGRGRDVTEFGDYFRTQRWNQAPGSDQPMLSKDIIKAKVASSIAHLYKRPRVWLEGFHSSGWGTSSADVTDAIFANFVAGYNLLSFHGLYYSTMGGWWEWAPPDNHFRMPYWNHIDPLMTCVRRLSYLLSQGYHNCDIAIMYPTEPVVAEMDGDKSVSLAFETGELLYDRGIDFDFIDFESLARTEVKNKELNISNERYKVLIVPSMKAIRYSSLRKIEEFVNAGGVVVNIADIPEANDTEGINNPETKELVRKLFSGSRNMIRCKDAKEVLPAIEGSYAPGFKILSEVKERPFVTHRVTGKRDVYALYNFPAGSRCFFRTEGRVQLWDPWSGKVLSLSDFSVKTREGTEVTLPLAEKEIQIIVFDHSDTAREDKLMHRKVLKEYDLGNKWNFELKPSLDNRWGDFELPASNELLGAEIRQLYLSENNGYHGGRINHDESWKKLTCGFGEQFLKLGPLPVLPSDEEIQNIMQVRREKEAVISGKKYSWEGYSFSWKLGVEGDYGHQGYHGLKGEMYDNFIRLGAMEDIKMSLKRIPEQGGNFYILYTQVIAPADGIFDILRGDAAPARLYVNNSEVDAGSSSVSLKKGRNPVTIIYGRSCETYLVFRKHGVPEPLREPVSTCWYRDPGVLPFDCSSSSNPSGTFMFESAPGLQSLSFAAYGKVSVWIDGIITKAVAGKKESNGLTGYRVDVKNINTEGSQVVIKIEYQQGYAGGGAIPGYLRQKCGKGIISSGDWSETDGLRSYSGGVLYGKTITVDPDDLKNQIEIDLGDLVSSAEVFVNGSSAGVKVAPPWTFDITGLVREGKNEIEILIYNTLANNYTAIPTRYRGSTKSGLTGPVKLRYLRLE